MHTDPGGAMNVAQTKSTMHSLAFGQAMAQAAEDYKKVSTLGTLAECYCPVGATICPDRQRRSPYETQCCLS